MSYALQLALIIFSGASVAMADGLVKRAASVSHGIVETLISPVMIFVAAIYLLQIVIFSFVFLRSWNLGIAGIMQIVAYSIVVIVASIVFFQEKISLTHGVGIFFALGGAILMNL